MAIVLMILFVICIIFLSCFFIKEVYDEYKNVNDEKKQKEKVLNYQIESIQKEITFILEELRKKNKTIKKLQIQLDYLSKALSNNENTVQNEKDKQWVKEKLLQ